MGDEPTNEIGDPFPAPPPFYHHFTTENLESFRHNKAPATESFGTEQHDDRPELAFLEPPEVPAGDKYSVFGTEYSLSNSLRTLEDNHVAQLYPSPAGPASAPDQHSSTGGNQSQIMVHLARSILLNFLELADIMSKNPKISADKIGDIQTLFYNAHHLVNEYRPHQARETLIAMMEERISAMRAEIQEVKDTEIRVNDMLANLGELGEDLARVEETDQMRAEQQDCRRLDDARRVWAEMQRIQN